MPLEKYSKSKYNKRAGTGTRKRKRPIKKNIPYKVPKTGPGPKSPPSPPMDGTIIPLSRMDESLRPLSRMDESLRPHGKMYRPLLNISPPRPDMTTSELLGTFRTNDQPSNLMYRGPPKASQTRKAMTKSLKKQVNTLENKIYLLEKEALVNGYNVLNPNWNDKKESSEWPVLLDWEKLDIAKDYHATLKTHLLNRARIEEKAKFDRDTKRIHSKILNSSLNKTAMAGLPLIVAALMASRNYTHEGTYQTPLLAPAHPDPRIKIASNHPFRQIETDSNNPLYYSQRIGDQDGINLEIPGAIEDWNLRVAKEAKAQQPMTAKTIEPYIKKYYEDVNKNLLGPGAPIQLTRGQLLNQQKHIDKARTRTQKKGKKGKKGHR